MNTPHDELRKKFWCDVFVTYVEAMKPSQSSHAKDWADHALQFFDERFPMPAALDSKEMRISAIEGMVYGRP